MIQSLSVVRRIVATALLAGGTLVYWAMLNGKVVPTGEQMSMLALMAAPDAVAIAALWLWPANTRIRSVMGWYGVSRSGLSVLMFNLPSAILYSFAGFVVLAAPRRPLGGSATTKHEFSAASGGWIGAMTPLTASRSWAGSLASGQRGCGVCGRGQEDPLHWAAEA